MKTIVCLTALFLVSACVGHTDAACGVQQRSQVKFQQQRIQSYAVQQVYQAIPTYSNIVWSVGSDIRDDAREREQEKRITKSIIEGLRKEINAGRLNAGGQTKEQTQAYGLTVLQQNCYKCHNPKSKAVIEERSPKLFDVNGNLTVSQQEIGSILTVIRKGIMPPKPAEPLNDDDYLAVKVYLESGTPPAPPVAAPQQQAPPQPHQPAPNPELPGT